MQTRIDGSSNDRKRKYADQLVKVSINMEKTGKNIKYQIQKKGYSIEDIMRMTGISTVQAIYKWYEGKSIPTIETQLALCKILDIDITELLVLDN